MDKSRGITKIITICIDIEVKTELVNTIK